MAEKAKSELTLLREEFKATLGKNASPKLTADDLRAAIAAAATAIADGAAPADAGANADSNEPAPAAAAKPAAQKGGKKAKAAAEAEEAPKGTALLDHPDPGCSASHQGVEIVRGKNGLYLVPLSFVPELLPHGFSLVRSGD